MAIKEGFVIVATSDPLRIGLDYVDQKVHETYEDALVRGEELLKHYHAFYIRKVYSH